MEILSWRWVEHVSEDTFSENNLFYKCISSSFPNLFITMCAWFRTHMLFLSDKRWKKILRIKMLLRLSVKLCYGGNLWEENALNHKVTLLDDPYLLRFLFIKNNKTNKQIKQIESMPLIIVHTRYYSHKIQGKFFSIH